MRNAAAAGPHAAGGRKGAARLHGIYFDDIIDGPGQRGAEEAIRPRAEFPSPPAEGPA